MYTLNDNRKSMVKRTISQALCLVMLLCVITSIIPVTYCEATTPSEPASPVTAASNVFLDMITDMSSQIYVTMRGLAIPVIICFVGYAGLCALTGGAKGVEKCVDIMKKCLIAVCLVAFAPLIGQQLGNWVKGSGTGDLGQYNPLLNS
jgi:hypothetical protein